MLLTASAVRQGRRVIMVLAGMKTIKERGTESAKVLDWSYREFNNYTVAKAGDVIDQAPVWMGDQGQGPFDKTLEFVFYKRLESFFENHFRHHCILGLF